MAGRGPAPGANPNRKDPGQRRRRNAEPKLEGLPRSERDNDVPELPETYKVRVSTKRGLVTRNVTFLAETRQWYDDWANSPMAVEFTRVHWLRLQDIARLQDMVYRGDLGVVQELRLQLAGFGGTPMDLRRLGRRIEPPAPEAPGRQGGAEVVDAAAARRKRLQAVPDTAG